MEPIFLLWILHAYHILVSLYYLLTCVFGCILHWRQLHYKSTRMKHPALTTKLNEETVTKQTKLCLRVVTRGTYAKLVQETVSHNAKICEQQSLPFVIEIVTDCALNINWNETVGCTVVETVVPQNYMTNFGAVRKARALQYCIKHNLADLSSSDWILHLDEESLLTSAAIDEIMTAMQESDMYTIWHGPVVYGRRPQLNSMLTHYDNMRVAQDIGALTFETSIFGRPISTIKGSYLLVHNAVEQLIGYDFVPEQCLTEDMTFAMRTLDLGCRFRMFTTPIIEQSVHNWLDLLNQRRRWFCGAFMTLLLKTDRLSWRARLPFLIFHLNWWLAPYGVIMGILYYATFNETLECIVAITGHMNFEIALTVLRYVLFLSCSIIGATASFYPITPRQLMRAFLMALVTPYLDVVVVLYCAYYTIIDCYIKKAHTNKIYYLVTKLADMKH